MKEDNDKPEKTLKIKIENIFMVPSLLTTVLKNNSVHTRKANETLEPTLSMQIIKTQLKNKKFKLNNLSKPPSIKKTLYKTTIVHLLNKFVHTHTWT